MQDIAGGLRNSLSNGRFQPTAESGLNVRSANLNERDLASELRNERTRDGTKDDKRAAFSVVWAAMAAGGGGVNAAGLVSGGRMIAPDEMFEIKGASMQTASESGSAGSRNVDATKANEHKRRHDESPRNIYRSGDDHRIADAKSVQIGALERPEGKSRQDIGKGQEPLGPGDKYRAHRSTIHQDSRSTRFNGQPQNTVQSESASGKDSIETTGLAKVMPELSVNQAARGASTKSSAGPSVRVAEQVGRYLAQSQDSGLTNPRLAKDAPKGAERGRGKDESSEGSRLNTATNEPSTSKTEEKVNDFERLVATMRLRLGARRSTARLELHPPELGRMSVDVRMDQKAVNIDVRTDSEEARRLVDGRANDLATALERHGIRIARMDVSVSGTHNARVVADGSRTRGGSNRDGVGNGRLTSDSRVDFQSRQGKKRIANDEESWVVMRHGFRMDLVA